MLRRQVVGLSANLAAGLAITSSDARRVPEMIEQYLKADIEADQMGFAEKMGRAAARYRFLDSPAARKAADADAV